MSTTSSPSQVTITRLNLPKNERNHSSDSITPTSTNTSSITSKSCPEFRNGFRLQKRAYERKIQAPTLASIISNRRPKNEYVDRLKEFYGNSDTYGADNEQDKALAAKRFPSLQSHPPTISSVLRLPEVKPFNQSTPRNDVVISLPQERPTTRGILKKHSVNSLPPTMTHSKIPPPVPVQISSARPRLEHGDGNLSSSLSSNLAASILEELRDLKKPHSTKKSAKSYQQQQQHNKRRKVYRYKNTYSDPKSLAMKMTLPCRIGCCYCVYTSLHGPVKIFLTRGQRPKRGPWVAGIRDGHGRLVIPISRKSDITGLVYDAHNHSLHPPAKGQRPLYPPTKVPQRDKTKVVEKKCARGNTKEVRGRT